MEKTQFIGEKKGKDGENLLKKMGFVGIKRPNFGDKVRIFGENNGKTTSIKWKTIQKRWRKGLIIGKNVDNCLVSVDNCG